MSFDGWLVFASFWVVFVTSPGPNAVNCIETSMSVGFRRALPCVAAILCQAGLFLALSALGVTAAIAASPVLFDWLRLLGAGVLVWFGWRSWRNAGTAPRVPAAAGSIFGRAFLIATVNAKSVAGYLAAFTQFVEPSRPISEQMVVIVPTALTLTALSYTGYTALGTVARGLVENVWFRRSLALLYIGYGVTLGVLGSARGL